MVHEQLRYSSLVPGGSSSLLNHEFHVVARG